ncbi:hypothetical protein [Fischerella sp. PCC 9605]|uniref:hypothetical protein n=1 Tax=Fischerella sp. PCC 9605 TaxID=1173024 RepID=UPI0018CC568A|nr:hypothetical protein [Fischerella sp. PCC 9605]
MNRHRHVVASRRVDAIDAQAASGTVECQELSFSIQRENKIIPQICNADFRLI